MADLIKIIIGFMLCMIMLLCSSFKFNTSATSTCVEVQEKTVGGQSYVIVTYGNNGVAICKK